MEDQPTNTSTNYNSTAPVQVPEFSPAPPSPSRGSHGGIWAGIIVGLIGSLVFSVGGLLFLLAGPGLTWVNSVLPLNSATTQTISQTLAVQEESATIDVVKQVKPAVVSIVISKDVSQQQNYFGPFDNSDSGDSQPVQVGGGTGFIVSADGLILTNRHVVSDETAEYTVVMDDGTEYPATVLGRDTFNDIAVVKIEATDLPTLELGDSDTLQAGQTVIAVGNVLAVYQNTVTKGIVSGLARSLGEGQLTDLIQTDAAINQGNSGGPLVNLDGQVVGINTAVDRGGEGIGFAIPITEARVVVDSIKQFGRIVRPYIGVRYIMIDDELQTQNDLPYNYGALVQADPSQPKKLAVVPGSPADKAGIEANDIILEIDGQKVEGAVGLPKALEKYTVGDTITLKVYHDGQEVERTATLVERPADNQ